MRVVFMGTPEYATKILQSLLKSVEVVGIFTQPDKPVGRKQLLTPPNVKRFLLDNGLDIPLFQPPNLKDPKIAQEIKRVQPDFIVVAAYGQILPKSILSIAPCINLHASLLPKYRGASPIQQALLEGEKITGVTAMLMDEGLDTGDILAYCAYPIKPKDTAITLFNTLADLAAKLTPKVLQQYQKLQALPQWEVDASYCKKIKKSDGLVEFEDAKEIYDKYRAFIVWPGIFLASGLKLKKIELVDTSSSNRPGRIEAIESDGVVVGCAKGRIKLLRVQPPSKREMEALDYIRGKRIGIGDTLV